MRPWEMLRLQGLKSQMSKHIRSFRLLYSRVSSVLQQSVPLCIAVIKQGPRTGRNSVLKRMDGLCGQTEVQVLSCAFAAKNDL